MVEWMEYIYLMLGWAVFSTTVFFIAAKDSLYYVKRFSIFINLIYYLTVFIFGPLIIGILTLLTTKVKIVNGRAIRVRSIGLNVVSAFIIQLWIGSYIYLFIY